MLDPAAYVDAARDAGFLFPEVSGRLLELKATTRGEELERVTRALVHLDPERLHVPEPAGSFVVAFGQLMTALVYSSGREAREDLAPLMRRVIRAAAAAQRREEADAAAERAALQETAAWEAREAEARRWREQREKSA